MLVCKSRYTTNIIQHTKVSILMTVCLSKMAYNGKSICEERATLQTISKENRLEQKLFLPTKLLKNRRVGKVFCGYC